MFGFQRAPSSRLSVNRPELDGRAQLSAFRLSLRPKAAVPQAQPGPPASRAVENAKVAGSVRSPLRWV